MVMLLEKCIQITRFCLVFATLSVISSCTDFGPNQALDLDGYGNYPTEVAPIRDLGEAAYTGTYLNDSTCGSYTLKSSGANGLARELTALIPGALGLTIPLKNADFTFVTRIQFLETCSSDSATCVGITNGTKDKCCPDGNLSLEKSWAGKTDENGDFSLTIALSPEKWAFQNNDGTTTKTEVDNLYFMDSGSLKLLKFEYEVEFKSTGLGSACVDVCKSVDFCGKDDFKAECERLCVDGKLTFQTHAIDLMTAKTHCPDVTSDTYRFGKFVKLYPKFTQVKSDDGKSAPLLGAQVGAPTQTEEVTP